MFAALRADFSERRRERCVRLDLLPGGRLGGGEEWARLLGAALRETFEARARAYDAEARPARRPAARAARGGAGPPARCAGRPSSAASAPWAVGHPSRAAGGGRARAAAEAGRRAQVRRLMAGRQAAGWRFEELFLAKDSLARMLEAAGMAEDALRELSELEACFLEALAPGGALAGLPFGAPWPLQLVAEHQNPQLDPELEACFLEALAPGGALAGLPFGATLTLTLAATV